MKHSFGKGKVIAKTKGFDAADAKHKALKAALHKRHGQEQFSRLKSEGKNTPAIKSIERKTGKRIGLDY